MKTTWMARHALPLLLMLVLTACASTIGNKIDLEEAKFEVGVTTKDDIADTLGLPNAIARDKAAGREFWAYNESPELTGLILPVVTTTGGTLSANTVTVPHFGTGQAQKAALVCTFDLQGVLVEVKKLK